MAITRRQFVTRLGALAATVGLSQGDLSQITQAFAHDSIAPYWQGGFDKPQVIWIHGAECTGCSTSLLSLFENATEKALADPASTVTLAGALTGIAGTLPGAIAAGTTHGHRTLNTAGFDFDKAANAGTDNVVNVADVLIDFIALEYHETVMGPGGDLAYKWLADRMASQSRPFVLVVEGAVQPRSGNTDAMSWCSIAASDAEVEIEFEDAVWQLSQKATAIISIGQCACYGGYPGCKSPVYSWSSDFGGKQTTAMGVHEFLAGKSGGHQNKVIAVPGCPTNPWWFVLTTVLWMYDVIQGPLKKTGAVNGPLGIVKSDLSLNAAALDGGWRLNAVYGSPVHGPGCPRYNDYTAGVLATKPGDPGCLKLLGCKGVTTNSLCAVHGWNGQQPLNPSTWDQGVSTAYAKGGFCPAAGAPCMGCTEKGYPDVDVPFVRW
jgi:hydrogenase small subunit